MNTESFDATAQSVGTKAALAGGGTSVLGWFATSEAVALVGMLCAIAGLGVTIFFAVRRDRREAREHHLKMAQLRARARDA